MVLTLGHSVAFGAFLAFIWPNQICMFSFSKLFAEWFRVTKSLVYWYIHNSIWNNASSLLSLSRISFSDDSAHVAFARRPRILRQRIELHISTINAEALALISTSDANAKLLSAVNQPRKQNDNNNIDMTNAKTVKSHRLHIALFYHLSWECDSYFTADVDV